MENEIMNDSKKKMIIAGIKLRMRDSIRESGCSLEEFCKDTGIEKSTLYNTKSYPSSYIVLLVAGKCGKTTDFILRGVE